MKLLICCLALIFSQGAIADTDNVTCVLSKKFVDGKVSSRPAASRVRVYERVANDVYEVSNFEARRYATTFEEKDPSGLFYRLEILADDTYLFKGGAGNITINPAGVLEVNVSTGGYPGAGPAPERVDSYNCKVNYPSIIGMTRDELARGFGLRNI